MTWLAVHRRVVASAALAAACASAIAAPSAAAFDPLKPLCRVGGAVSQVTGRACGVGPNGGAGSGFAAATTPALGSLPSLSPGSTIQALGFAALGAWVLGGAKSALDDTATLLSQTTTPRLRSTWFSSTYRRMAAIAGVLTLPFLFAAAVQALIRSELALLVRAAFGYLPLATVMIAVAAPLTMLLLAASDELSRAVAAASGGTDASFLRHAAGLLGGLSLAARSPFLAFLVGVFTVAGAVVLWIELLMREAAVYVIVLMLPLAFAALVWPARRIWAVRTVEVLVALILSKFAIVAVLSLGGAAMSASAGFGSWLAGLVLLVMGAFTPWALLRFVPLAELAAGTAGALRHESRQLRLPAQLAGMAAFGSHDWARSATAQMRRDAAGADAGDLASGAGESGRPHGLEPASESAPSDRTRREGEGGPAAEATRTIAAESSADTVGAAAGAPSDLDAVAGVDGSTAPGAATSPESSSAPTSAPPPDPEHAPGAHARADIAGGWVTTPTASADESDPIAGLQSPVDLDHELFIGLEPDGVSASRPPRASARAAKRTAGRIEPGPAPAAEDEDLTPAPQPRQDGPL